MQKSKHNWIDELEIGDMIQKHEVGVSYAFMGINEEGEYMLHGLPWGYERYLMEDFKLVRKKNKNNS